MRNKPMFFSGIAIAVISTPPSAWIALRENNTFEREKKHGKEI
jgi:hypothetical protein